MIKDTKLQLSGLRLRNNCYHVVDATGVGLPVIDLMCQSQLSPLGIWITGGLVSSPTSYGYTVPKEELIASLQMVLSTGRLKSSNQLDPELVAQLRHEFQHFTEKKTKTLGTTYEAWRASDHNDLLLSLAMNVWWIFQHQGVSIYHPRESAVVSMEDYDPFEGY